MIPYFIVLAISSALMFYAQSVRTVKSYVKIIFFLLFCGLTVFPGIRSTQVGTDTPNYVYSFTTDKFMNDPLLESKSNVELGYQALERTLRSFTDNYVVLFFTIAFIVVGIYLLVIYRNSEHYGISIFVFITLGIYLYFFNGARQAISAAIFGLAITPLINGKFVRYLIVIVIASLFHKTVLLGIPLYFLFRQKFTIRSLILLTILTILITTGLSIALQFSPSLVAEKYAQYDNRTSGGGLLLMIVYVVMTGAFIFARKLIPGEHLKKYDIYLNMAVFTGLVYVMVNLFGKDVNLIRLTLYYAYGFILIWPIIFKNLGMFRSTIPWIFFYSVHLIFFYIYINKMSRLVPYIVNNSLF
jgi:transmembrane protein EpsG